MRFCRMGFHPDTAAGEYVDCESGRAMFDGPFAELVVQPLLDDGDRLLGERVYEIGMAEFQVMLNVGSICGNLR